MMLVNFLARMTNWGIVTVVSCFMVSSVARGQSGDITESAVEQAIRCVESSGAGCQGLSRLGGRSPAALLVAACEQNNARACDTLLRWDDPDTTDHLVSSLWLRCNADNREPCRPSSRGTSNGGTVAAVSWPGEWSAHSAWGSP
jgi:hypothetical protein